MILYYIYNIYIYNIYIYIYICIGYISLTKDKRLITSHRREQCFRKTVERFTQVLLFPRNITSLVGGRYLIYTIFTQIRSMSTCSLLN